MQTTDEQPIVRRCNGTSEFQLCVDLQKEIWRSPDLTVPLNIFVVAAETGGEVLGAWHADQFVGFTFAIAAVEGSQHYLHSHMTAVSHTYQHAGIGRKLKFFQREQA